MSWPTEVRALLAELLDKEEKPAEPKPKPTADDQRAGLKEVRDHLKRVGATLAAGATALLTGLGWIQLHNVFPAPANHKVLVPLLAFLGASSALIGVGWLMRTIFAAQRRIPIVSDADALGEAGSLTERERRIRRDVFKSVADENGEPSLRAMELKARESERKAEAAETPAEKARLEAQAARLDAAVDGGMLGAAKLILEERSGNAFRGKQTRAAFILAALGIIVAFGVADYSKGQRDLIALRKSCAEAAAAGVKDPCESIVEFNAGPSSSDAANTTAATAVAIGVLRRGSSCAVSVRVDGKRTRATKAGLASLTITDLSRSCGVRLGAGGFAFGSGWRHTGISTVETRLKQLSYAIVMLRGRSGSPPTVREIPVEPLVAGPQN